MTKKQKIKFVFKVVKKSSRPILLPSAIRLRRNKPEKKNQKTPMLVKIWLNDAKPMWPVKILNLIVRVRACLFLPVQID